MRKRQRLTAVLALTLGLAALPATAAGPMDRAPAAWQGLAGVWSWIAERLALPFGMQAASCDQSWLIDPDGRCGAGLLAVPGGGDAATPDESWHIDPDGSTAPPDLPRSDESSHIDPNG
jgi:hypothetical protein